MGGPAAGSAESGWHRAGLEAAAADSKLTNNHSLPGQKRNGESSPTDSTRGRRGDSVRIGTDRSGSGPLSAGLAAGKAQDERRQGLLKLGWERSECNQDRIEHYLGGHVRTTRRLAQNLECDRIAYGNHPQQGIPRIQADRPGELNRAIKARQPVASLDAADHVAA